MALQAMLKKRVFNEAKANSKMQLFYALTFFGFTVLALGIDSIPFRDQYFDGRMITNVLAIAFFLLLFYSSGTYLRKLMVGMVFLSYIGELIFCTLLGMYAYKETLIPLYVPFGHAIVYGSGYIMSKANWSVKNDAVLKKGFNIFFALLFLGVGFYLKDYFSLFFGLLFFWILKRKRWNTKYAFIALCVIYIELVGTYFQCWAWEPKIFGWIPTVNPPMGALFFYAGGDVLLAKIIKK